jgi:peptidoglycan/LPS O-acetylase OafA/YrhL
MIKQLADRPGVCWGVATFAYLTVVLVDTNFRFAARLPEESALMFQSKMFLQGIAAMFFVLPMALGDRPSRLRSMAANRHLAWIGVISYGVYLWHQTIIKQVGKWLALQPTFGGFLILLVLVMPSAVLVGWISFRLIEKPALSLAR